MDNSTSTANSNVTVAPSSPAADVITVDQIVLATLGGAVSVVAIVLNVVVLVTIGRTPSLRRLPNTLIASLAVADLLRAATIGGIFVARLIVVTPPSSDGDAAGSADDLSAVWCAVARSLMAGLEAAVVYHSALIAVERAFLISRPLAYQCLVTPAKMTVVVVSTWVACTLYAGLQNLG